MKMNTKKLPAKFGSALFKNASLGIVLAVGILATLFLAPKALAQSELQLTVSPPISYLQVPPGTSRTHTVVLENDGNQTITVLPSIVDFASDGKTGRAVISNQLSFPYISFGQSVIQELSIPPKKRAQLTLYIDVPADAVEKEYPLTILFFSKDNQGYNNLSTTSSEITGGIGSNLVVLTSHNSDFQQVPKVLDLNTPKIVDSFSSIEFTPLIENESLASYSASGSAKIVNWRKDTQVEFELYPDVILGNSTRELRALRPGISSDQPETGSFSYKPKMLLGPYQVVITLNNSQGEVTQYVEVVYAFPFSVAIIILVGIVISLIYSKKIKRKPF